MLLAPKNRHHRTTSPRTTTEEDSMTSSTSTAAAAGRISPNSDINLQSSETRGINSSKKTTENVHTSKFTIWFVRFCQFLSFSTGFGAILGIITNLLLLSVPSPAPDVMIRLYSVSLCFLSLLSECEWARLFAWFGFLDSWIGRGFLNLFSGVLIMEFKFTVAAQSPEAEGAVARTWLLREISGIFLVTVGCVYLFGGILCLNKIKEGYANKVRKREQVRQEKADLETRRQEIEMLLRETESQLEKI